MTDTTMVEATGGEVHTRIGLHLTIPGLSAA